MDGLIYTDILILFLIGLNAFFSLIETALTAASRAKMATLEKAGDIKTGRVNQLLEERAEMIGAIFIRF